MRTGWWRFWRKPAIEADVSTVANLPILKMVSKEDPFDKWCPPSVHLEEKYEVVVRLGVWGYQVYLYNKLIEARFGPEVASLARTHQIIALNRVNRMGEEFGNLLALVEEGVNSPPMKAPTDQGEITIPVEMNVALWLLLRMIGSPYYVPSARLSSSKLPKIHDELDWHFAECLEFGKSEALRAFSPIIDKVTLTPASVSGLRVPTTDERESDPREIIWSTNPACFERHLQRRHRNVLFPPERREVKQSEVDGARQRDEEDTRLLLADEERLLTSVTSSPNRCSYSEANQLREEIDRVLERAAEVGGEAGERVASEMSKLRRELMTVCENALADQPEALNAFRDAEAHYHAGVHIYTNAFIAQMHREDTPIARDEIVPALLSENAQTIRIALQAMGEKGGVLLQGCRTLVEELRCKGVDVSELDTKLRSI